jgi:hypothetical protein
MPKKPRKFFGDDTEKTFFIIFCGYANQLKTSRAGGPCYPSGQMGWPGPDVDPTMLPRLLAESVICLSCLEGQSDGGSDRSS